jgi:ubiquinone/menaquinone biosynthesis C-methylase UbiE
MSNDPYDSIAERYDRMMISGNAVRKRFFRELFSKNKISTALDCACGTGRDLIMFHSLGCSACGSDRSEAMLVQARKNIAAAPVEIPLTKTDYRELGRHFDSPLRMGVRKQLALSPDDAKSLS